MQGTQTNNCTIDSNDFKVSDIRTQRVKANSSGGKSVKTFINGGPIYLQFPIMKTWGVNLYIDEKSGKKSYEIPYQFPDKEELVVKSSDTPAEIERKKSVLKLWDTLVELDEWAFQQGVKNCQEWFGIPNDQEGKEFMVRSKHKTILKYPKDPTSKVPDKNRPPSFSAKVPYYEKSEGYGKERKVFKDQWEFHTEVYNCTDGSLVFSKDYPDTTVDPKTGTPIDFTTFLQSGQNSASEVKHGGIYINGGMFGQTFQATQIVPLPLKQYKRGVCHVKIPAAQAAAATESDGEPDDDGVGDENEQFPVNPTPEPVAAETAEPVEKTVENVEVPPSVVETDLQQEPVVTKTVKKRVAKKAAAANA